MKNNNDTAVNMEWVKACDIKDYSDIKDDKETAKGILSQADFEKWQQNSKDNKYLLIEGRERPIEVRAQKLSDKIVRFYNDTIEYLFKIHETPEIDKEWLMGGDDEANQDNNNN